MDLHLTLLISVRLGFSALLVRTQANVRICDLRDLEAASSLAFLYQPSAIILLLK